MMPPPGPDIASQPLGEFLSDLASRTPSPGGGAVASVVGALASALGRMVLAYSGGRKEGAPKGDPAAAAAELGQAAGALERASGLLLELAAEDAAAYGLLSQLWKLPEGDERRVREYPGAVAAAVQAPLATCAACCDLLRLIASLAGKTNRRLDSDLAIAALLAEAGAKAGAWNVRANLPLLADDERKRVWALVEDLLGQAASLRQQAEQICSGA